MTGLKRKIGDICPLCSERIETFYININDTIIMCENEKCSYPFEDKTSTDGLFTEQTSPDVLRYSNSYKSSSSSVFNNVEKTTSDSDGSNNNRSVKRLRTDIDLTTTVSESFKSVMQDDIHKKDNDVLNLDVNAFPQFNTVETNMLDILNMPPPSSNVPIFDFDNEFAFIDAFNETTNDLVMETATNNNDCHISANSNTIDLTSLDYEEQSTSNYNNNIASPTTNKLNHSPPVESPITSRDEYIQSPTTIPDLAKNILEELYTSPSFSSDDSESIQTHDHPSPLNIQPISTDSPDNFTSTMKVSSINSLTGAVSSKTIADKPTIIHSAHNNVHLPISTIKPSSNCSPKNIASYPSHTLVLPPTSASKTVILKK